jgi:hypothetical protein
MDKMANKNDEKLAWWEPAVVIFSQASAWIVAPIVIALIAGKALDQKFGTEPWIFLGLTAAAFVVSCFGIVMITVRYTKKLEKELLEKKKSDKQSGKNGNQQLNK